MEEYTGYWISY